MASYKVDITGINTANLTSLTHEENMELFERMHNNDPYAKELLINGNLKLVLSILKGFSRYNINMDDLFQVGVIGLIKAIDNFDTSYNLKLSTYGVPLIIGEIKKYLRDNTSSLRISRSIKDNAYQILRYKENYININGKEPTYDEIAKDLGISHYEISIAIESLREPVSIFEPIYSDGGDPIYLEDQIADEKEKQIDRDMIISMNRALKKVHEREKNILIERFVIGKTQSEIADHLNISQAQVSRIEKNAIAKVRKLVR